MFQFGVTGYNIQTATCQFVTVIQTRTRLVNNGFERCTPSPVVALAAGRKVPRKKHQSKGKGKAQPKSRGGGRCKTVKTGGHGQRAKAKFVFMDVRCNEIFRGPWAWVKLKTEASLDLREEPGNVLFSPLI